MSQGFAQPQPRPASKPSPTASVSEVSQHLQNYCGEIEAPRVERSRMHELMDILMISILAVIAGAKGWEDIEIYGSSKPAWLAQFLSLPNGIPCPDTFRRVFVERIDPSGFERCFQRWVSSLVNTLGAQVIPIDGKALMTERRGKRPCILSVLMAGRYGQNPDLIAIVNRGLPIRHFTTAASLTSYRCAQVPYRYDNTAQTSNLKPQTHGRIRVLMIE